MSKDLTKLSRKELETKLRKKYGVEKYLNQRSQLLDLLGNKGETDIETGFTGPETEALSIMLENIMTSKAGGGIIGLLGGGKVNAPRQTEIKGQDHMLAYITPEEGGLLKALGGAGKKGPMGIPSFFGPGGPGDDGTDPSGTDEGPGEGPGASGGPSEGNDPTGNTDGSTGNIGGSSTDMGIDSSLSDMESIQAGLESTGPADIGGDESDSPEPPRQESVVQKPKEENIPLTQEELDYYARGMGTATKPLKSLEDVNKYMSTLIGTTASPTGAKFTKDKKYLILPNGKIINLKTGKVTETMSGLELFRGGMI